MNNLCEISNLSLSLKGRRVLDDISLQVGREQVVTLLGPNGAGKTSLFKVIIGAYRARTGKVRLADGIRISYVPQQIHVDPLLPITVRRFLAFVKDFEHSRFYLRLGLDQLLDTPLQKVSGGEMQRVLLAYALASRPELLILDEPAQGMDISSKSWFYHLLREIRDAYRCGIMIASHDLHFVTAATDHVVCLNRHICCQGHPDSVTTHPEYLKLFPSGAEKDYAVYVHDYEHMHDHMHDHNR